MSQPLLMLAAFAGAGIVTAILTPLVAAYARRHDLVDEPGGRKIHARAVPRLGGVAVFFGLVTGIIAYTAAFGTDRLLTLVYSEGHVALLIPCTMVFVMGVIDDVRDITPRVKLVVQAAAAMVCIQAGFVIDEVWTPFGWSVPLGLFAYPVTLLWFIGVTNAFNLIDGLDGLLTSVGIASLLGCAFVAVGVKMHGTPYFPIALAGALAGFLPYNWHRARVFIGDSGAMLVGFVVAALALKVSRYEGPDVASRGVAVHVMLALAAIPAAETFLSVFRRHVAGQPYFAGDSSHMHHVLITHKGLTVRRAVTVLALAQLMFSGIAVASRMRLGWYALVPSTILLAGAVFGIWWMGYVEFRVLWRRAVHLLLNRSRREIADSVRVARAGDIIRRVSSPARLVEALRTAVDLGRFAYIALEFTEEGGELVKREKPELETTCRAAREFARNVNGKPTWLFSARDEAACAPAKTDPAAFHGSVRYSVPVPAEDGSLCTLICERKFDHRGRAVPATDIKAYVAEALEDALAAIRARDTNLRVTDGDTTPHGGVRVDGEGR